MSWLNKQDISDVQAAIQTQTIQTALEKDIIEDPLTGFPVAIKMVNNITALGGAAAQQALLFDTIVFNYGGYVVSNVGAFKSNVTIPEQGVYDVRAQIGTTANSQTIMIALRMNGSTTLPWGETALVEQGAAAITVNPWVQVTSLLLCKAGDVIDAVWAQPTGGVQNGFAGSAILSIHKVLGR